LSKQPIVILRDGIKEARSCSEIAIDFRLFCYGDFDMLDPHCESLCALSLSCLLEKQGMPTCLSSAGSFFKVHIPLIP
jgi:hypothetical protein